MKRWFFFAVFMGTVLLPGLVLAKVDGVFDLDQDFYWGYKRAEGLHENGFRTIGSFRLQRIWKFVSFRGNAIAEYAGEATQDIVDREYALPVYARKQAGFQTGAVFYFDNLIFENYIGFLYLRDSEKNVWNINLTTFVKYEISDTVVLELMNDLLFFERSLNNEAWFQVVMRRSYDDHFGLSFALNSFYRSGFPQEGNGLRNHLWFGPDVYSLDDQLRFSLLVGTGIAQITPKEKLDLLALRIGVKYDF